LIPGDPPDDPENEVTGALNMYVLQPLGILVKADPIDVGV